MTKAVKDGRLVYTSASQINTHKACARKWYYCYRLGFRPPATKAQSGGLNIHAEMESYAKDRTKIPTSPGPLKFINDHPTWWLDPDQYLIEHPKDKKLGLMVEDVILMGAIDLLTKPQNGLVKIVDWKSASSYRYVLKPEDFDTNIQLLTYAKYAITEYPESDVTLAHVYFRTDGHVKEPYRIVTSGVYDPATVDANYQAFVVPEVYDVKDTCAKTDVEDVTYNTDKCFQYGACVYRFACSAFRAKYGTPRGHDVFKGALPGSEDVLGIKSTQESIMSLDDLFGPQKAEPTKSDMAKLEDRADAVPEEERINPPDAATGPLLPKADFSLYINCVVERDPDGFTYNYLDELILEYAAPICKVANVQDVREIDFGKGKLALLRAFRDNPPKGNIYAREYGLQLDVLEVLLPMAKVVVRG